MNGLKLLEVAKRNPKTFSIVAPPKGSLYTKATIVRRTPSGYKETTIDCKNGKILGSRFSPKNSPLIFHYGKLDYSRIIDVYDESVASYPCADVTRHEYYSLRTLRKIITDAYEAVKNKTKAE